MNPARTNGVSASLTARRELFTVLLLLATAAAILLGLVGFALDYWAGVSPMLPAATVLAAIWCAWGTPTAHARPLLILALVAAALGIAIDLVHAVSAGLSSRFTPTAMLFADVLVDQAVSLVAILAGALALSHLAGRAPARGPYQQPYGMPPQQQLPAATPIPPPLAPPLPPQQQPTWPVESASGAAWTTAGEAASGAPGTGWSEPGADETTWQPRLHRPGHTGPEDQPR